MSEAARKFKVNPLREIGQSLPIALLKAREAAMEQFRPMLRQYGLTEQQWRVIRVLEGNGSLEVSELAEKTLLLAPSVSRILQLMEKGGLVARESVLSDGRRFRISLTPAGQQLFELIAPSSEMIYKGIEKRFGRKRLQQLLILLEQLEGALVPSATPE